jgi:hypothetical protein
MSNQLSYYSFTITKKNNEKETVSYTTRSPTQAKLRAEKYAKEIGGVLNPKYTKTPTPLKPSDPKMKKIIQSAFFG